MSRLIDADALIKVLNKNSIFQKVTNSEGKNVIEIINEQPTAHDVDNVVEQLEEIYEWNSKRKKEAYEEQDWEKFDFLTSENIGIYKAIAIVKKGGTDEN